MIWTLADLSSRVWIECMAFFLDNVFNRSYGVINLRKQALGIVREDIFVYATSLLY